MTQKILSCKFLQLGMQIYNNSFFLKYAALFDGKYVAYMWKTGNMQHVCKFLHMRHISTYAI